MPPAEAGKAATERASQRGRPSKKHRHASMVQPTGEAQPCVAGALVPRVSTISTEGRILIMIARTLAFLYGTAAYAVFFATFLYAVGFVGNFAVPKSMDSPAEDPWHTALLIDLGLLAMFALQHSIMARPAFKRVLTRFVSPVIERSTYVLASSLALIVLFWQWRPLGGVVWNVENQVGAGLLFAGFALGWTLVLVTTFVINHFDLFGLRQVWRNLRGQPQQGLRFVTPVLYRIVRHPLYVGWLLAFWCTPTMTATHLLFAAMTTAYILIAIQFEERDLMREHPEYAAYRKRVPMLIPRLSRRENTGPGIRAAARP
jgi:protein-S-isoprenylcysteine O-methyltransferase Ste14